MGRAVCAASAVAALAVGASAWAQSKVNPCLLITLADITNLGVGHVTSMSYDEGTVLPTSALPGLPSDVRTDHCLGDIRLSNAVSVRLGALVPKVAMDASAWERMQRALDDDKDVGRAAAGKKTVLVPLGRTVCDVNSWPTKPGRLHEVSCSHATSRRVLELSFEHEDPSRLPATDKVRGLLDKIVLR